MNANRTQELEKLLTEASSAYYNGDAQMSDAEFDDLVDELRQLAPKSKVLKKIGAPAKASGFVETRHERPMGSLLKVNTLEDVTAWFLKYTSGAVFWSEKLDGFSLSLTYKEGKLLQAVTRGDGITGEDILVNVLKMHGIPKRIDFEGIAYVRCEAMLLIDDWKTHFPTKANPRNAAAGTARRHDGVGSEHLTVFAHDVISPDFDFVTEKEKYIWLQTFGFLCPDFGLVSSVDEMMTVHKRYEDGHRSTLPYEIDGLVERENDVAKSLELGETDGRPKGQRAHKFKALSGFTTLESVTWQVGRTGLVWPVAELKPVNVGGVTISRCSLDNVLQMRDKGLEIGCDVEIIRSNDVIPKLLRKTKPGIAAIDYPTVCPCCKTPLDERRDDAGTVNFLVCPNSISCADQAQYTVYHYLKSLNVKQFGDVLVQKLYESGLVKTAPDLYKLDVDAVAALPSVGEKVAAKSLAELEKRSQNVPVPLFVKALGFELFGEGFSKKALEHFGSFDKMRQGTVADFLAVEGIGQSVAEAAVQGFAAKEAAITELLKHVTLEAPVQAPTDGPLSGKSFCFTGYRDAAAESLIITKGGKIATGVSKKVTYLVCKDKSSGSSKNEKAKALGVVILSPDELTTVIGE
jgi:DNA ligase (NAD+)